MEELADRIVALGVGERDMYLAPGLRYALRNRHGHWDHFSAELFSSSWRVSGALLEKALESGLYLTNIYWSPGEFSICASGDANVKEINVYNVSLPRAIIEACVNQLEGRA